MTAEALVTQTPGVPEETFPPDPLLETVTPSPTFDATWIAQAYAMLTPAALAEIPSAQIRIVRPGPLSKVVSPITLSASLKPGDRQLARVELLGEDGRLLYRRIFSFSYTTNEGYGSLLTDIRFEIIGVAETARLVIQTQDEYGRVQALASQEIILISVGEDDLFPAGDLLEKIVIRHPENKILVQGGTVRVSGWARVPDDHSLLVELVATDGRIVGSRLAKMSASDFVGHNQFSAEVPYLLNSPEWVRVTVSEHGVRFAEPAHISTVEVLLSP
jgi:hypothetical protein